VSRNYQRQEYVMPLKGDDGREIEGIIKIGQHVYGAAIIP
jgi:hypothetical protein